jgi:arsenate reductase
MLFIEYPKCTTCKKAKAWLKEHCDSFEERNIVEQNPTAEELKGWLNMGIELKKLFNTSGMKYRELGLKDRLPNMSEDEAVELLASDGMLVKRPVLVGDDFVLTGFREKAWAEKLDK